MTAKPVSRAVLGQEYTEPCEFVSLWAETAQRSEFWLSKSFHVAKFRPVTTKYPFRREFNGFVAPINHLSGEN